MGHEGMSGAGLGLSLARTIVDLHGGVIRVADDRSSGTTMQVRLPLRSDATTPYGPGPMPAAPHTAAGPGEGGVPESPSRAGAGGPLAEALHRLAETPDDAPDIDRQLEALAGLAADRVDAAAFASVTRRRDGAWTTVATSSELADAVDQAQYTAGEGPCLQSLDSHTPVTLSRIATTMAWPDFRQAAAGLGLHTSVSIPLFAGSGATIATLNLYGRDTDAMAPLITGLWAIYDAGRPRPGELTPRPPGAGGEELLTGLADAVATRATIQLALQVIMHRGSLNAESAYVSLRLGAAAAGVSLRTAADNVIAGASAP